MNSKEKKLIDCVNEIVYHCLERGIDKKQIAEWLDDVIYDLPDDGSSDFISILYQIQDNLLFDNEF